MELFTYIFNPSELLDIKITEKIYNTFFPDVDHIYINSQFKKIKKMIPNAVMSDDCVTKNKIRVFFIQGHGENGITAKYKNAQVKYAALFNENHDEVNYPQVSALARVRGSSGNKRRTTGEIIQYGGNTCARSCGPQLLL